MAHKQSKSDAKQSERKAKPKAAKRPKAKKRRT
jgi:hypothetical protein